MLIQKWTHFGNFLINIPRIPLCAADCHLNQSAVPSDHDVARKQLGDAGAPVPQHSELLTVALQEAEGGPHQVAQLHASGAVLDGGGLFAGEEESLKDGRGTAEVPGRKPEGQRTRMKSDHLISRQLYQIQKSDTSHTNAT